VGGQDVPDEPIAPVGVFYDFDSWLSPHFGMMEPSAFSSARNAGVFKVAPLGPRGGKHYAIETEEGWRAWVTKYKHRVLTREMREVARRLGYDYKRKRAR
jgi:hypothetical protein